MLVADPAPAGDPAETAPPGTSGAVATAAVPSRSARAERSARGRSRTRRALRATAVLLAAAVVVAVPVTAQLELAHSRDRLAAAQGRAAGAEAHQEATEQRLTATALALTGHEADAVVAARAVAAARARLATTGVSEAELRSTLDATQRRLDEAEAARDARRRAVERLDELLPHVKSCVADMVRSLAIAARTTNPDLSPSAACRAASAPA